MMKECPNLFLEKLNEDIISNSFSEYNINYGGCGRAAAEFYKFFKKKKIFKRIGIKLLSDYYIPSSVNRSNTFKEPYIERHFSHIVLTVYHDKTWHVVDAGYGVIPMEVFMEEYFSHLTPVAGFMSYKKLVKYISEDVWNSRFNPVDIRKIKLFLRDR